MTKKQFKILVSFSRYTCGGDVHNAFFFDWSDKDIEEGVGFKYGVVCRLDTDHCNKTELLNHFYNWVFNSIPLPYYIRYKYAAKDCDRFKTPISLNF